MKNRENAEQSALLVEEAARLTARPRGRGMGEAALRTARREAESMARLRVSDTRQAAPSVIPAEPADRPAPTPRPDSARQNRAALRQVRWR